MKVKDNEGKNLKNTPVIVKIVAIFNNSDAILDISHIYNDTGEITFIDLIV